MNDITPTTSPPASPAAGPALTPVATQSSAQAWLVVSGVIPPLGVIVALWLWLGRHRPRLAALAVLISLICAGLYGWIFKQTHNPATYSYSYHSMRSDILPSGYAPAVITFSRPTEFSPTDPQQQAFTKDWQHSLNGQPVGSLAAYSSYVTGKLPTVMPKLTQTAFSQPPSSSDYQSFIKPLTAFAAAQLPKSSGQVSLSTPQAFTSANIKNNAWQFNLTTQNSDIAKPLSQWTGRLLDIWGQNGQYYLMVAAINQNWQANSQIWAQILNSIKVDQ